MWQISSWYLLCSRGREIQFVWWQSHELQNPSSVSSALISSSRCSQLHRTTLHVYTRSTTKCFSSVWNYIHRAVPQFPCLPPPHCPAAFSGSLHQELQENKPLGFHWQHTLESLSHPFSRWEALEGRQERNIFFFSFPINFHFFQVWVNSGHRATRMIWL